MDGGEINKYATGLMFLPLVELDKDLKVEGMLADSITAEDERNFLAVSYTQLACGFGCRG